MGRNEIKPAIECQCHQHHGATQLVVLTGGPGAGKTAVLELAKKQFCQHIVILPEAASIIFKGGFWRLTSVTARRSIQRAISHVQMEMENLCRDENRWALGFCDRGTLDGLAYWPGSEQEFFDHFRTSREIEYAKYAGVIHLRTPTEQNGYNKQNPYRIESALEASRIDERIAEIWRMHPQYQEIPSYGDFLDKANAVLQAMNLYIPVCCRKKIE